MQTAQACKHSIFCPNFALSYQFLRYLPIRFSERSYSTNRATQALVDVVDIEDDSSSSKSLVERLDEAPQKIFDVMTATFKNYLTHMIGAVKS